MSQLKLTVERLRELLNYDPETGVFTWRVSRGRRIKTGMVAGFVEARNGKPYRRVGIEGRYYHAGPLVWFYMTGEWPEHEVDHKDTDPSNNRWVNLRQATRSQNQHNRTVRGDSFTGRKGVRLQYSQHGNKVGYYVAQIGINGKRVYVGSFKTIDEAVAAYEGAAKLLHKKFART